MNSLPTVADYQTQLDNNNEQFGRLISSIFPDLDHKLIMQTFEVVSYLQETKVNYQIIPRIIRGLHNIMIGTGHGQVVAHVQGELVNISVRESEATELKLRAETPVK